MTGPCSQLHVCIILIWISAWENDINLCLQCVKIFPHLALFLLFFEKEKCPEYFFSFLWWQSLPQKEHSFGNVETRSPFISNSQSHCVRRGSHPQLVWASCEGSCNAIWSWYLFPLDIKSIILWRQHMNQMSLIVCDSFHRTRVAPVKCSVFGPILHAESMSQAKANGMSSEQKYILDNCRVCVISNICISGSNSKQCSDFKYSPLYVIRDNILCPCGHNNICVISNIFISSSNSKQCSDDFKYSHISNDKFISYNPSNFSSSNSKQYSHLWVISSNTRNFPCKYNSQHQELNHNCGRIIQCFHFSFSKKQYGKYTPGTEKLFLYCYQ